MFGRKKVKDKQKQQEEDLLVYWDVYYMGGHPLYPKPFPASVVICNHQLEVKSDVFKDDAEIVMRYGKIKNMTNLSDSQVRADRVFFKKASR
jgi:hypothetical protein